MKMRQMSHMEPLAGRQQCLSNQGNRVGPRLGHYAPSWLVGAQKGL